MNPYVVWTLNQLPGVEEDYAIITRLPSERWMEFRDLRLRALATDPEAFGQTLATASDYPEEYWRGRLETTRDGSTWIVFAAIDRQLVGMMGAFVHEDDRERRVATIWGVFVDTVARGRGVASALMTQLLGKLRETGMTSAKLAVNTEQAAAVHIYERHGFRIVGHTTVKLGDGLVHDEHLMEAWLND